jgi:ferredoxin-NADP reductase
VPLTNRDAYLCGSSAMVAATLHRLQSLGMPQDHIYVEDFGWSES